MNMPDTNKRFEGVYLPLDLGAKLRKAASDRGVSKTDIVIAALEMELSKVELTSDDYLWIAAQVRKNEQARANKANK